MTGVYLLFLFAALLDVVFIAIALRRRADEESAVCFLSGMFLFILVVAVHGLMWNCVVFDYPDLRLYATMLSLTTLLAMLWAHFGFCFTMAAAYLVFLTACMDIRCVSGKVGDTGYVYRGMTHWITGIESDSGTVLVDSMVTGSRGRSYNTAGRDRLIILSDSDGHLFIPNICAYTDQAVGYQFGEVSDDSKTVTAVSLRYRDGAHRQFDIFGHDTQAEGYAIPTFDDEIVVAD